MASFRCPEGVLSKGCFHQDITPGSCRAPAPNSPGCMVETVCSLTLLMQFLTERGMAPCLVGMLDGQAWNQSQLWRACWLTVRMWGVEEQPTEGTVDLSIFCDTPVLPDTLALPDRKEAGDKSLTSDVWDPQRVSTHPSDAGCCLGSSEAQLLLHAPMNTVVGSHRGGWR